MKMGDLNFRDTKVERSVQRNGYRSEGLGIFGGRYCTCLGPPAHLVLCGTHALLLCDKSTNKVYHARRLEWKCLVFFEWRDYFDGISLQ